MIMNHATDRIIELYKDSGFEVTIIPAPRKISAHAKHRKDTQEVIATHHFSWKEWVRSV
jgi:site-specific DNA-adenine methylase